MNSALQHNRESMRSPVGAVKCADNTSPVAERQHTRDSSTVLTDSVLATKIPGDDPSLSTRPLDDTDYGVDTANALFGYQATVKPLGVLIRN
jgi:hypothetical protein